MFKQKLKFNKQGNIALILVIMVTTLTLVSALTLALINISDLTANYHLLENENVTSQKDACLEEAMYRISQNLYAAGTYYLTIDDIYCDYQLSNTVAGLKTVTTTASTGSSLGFWQSSSVMEVNVSSTPISINSYKDLSHDIWDSYGWQYRMKIVVNADQVVGELHNFPVYVNLADLGSEFFDNTRDNGADIVVTSADGGTKLFKEIINFSNLSNIGEMHFLAPILVGGIDNYFYIYFGNAQAVESMNDNFWLSDYSLVYHFAIEGVAPDPLLAYDSSKSDNDGTTYSMNAYDYINCKVAKCFDFDGSVDTLEIDDSPINMSSAQGTISFWVNFNSVASASTLFHFYELASTDYIRSHVPAGGGYIDLVIEDEDVEKVNVRYMSPDTSGWHKLDYVQDGSGVKIYFDGQQKNLTEFTQSGAWWSDHLTFAGAMIGAGSWGLVSGAMDEFRVTSKALSAEWLATEYNNQNDRTTFYSTSTPEELPMPPPPECAGILAYGRCWFEASTPAMSCDQVCAENAKTCVPNVSYSGGCALNELFDDWACSAFSCLDATGYQTSPVNVYSVSDPTFKGCMIDAGASAYNCSELSTDGTEMGSPDFRAYILCACE